MAEGEFFQWIPTKMSNWQRVLQQILGIRIRMYISLLQNWHIFMVFSGAPCILDGSIVWLLYACYTLLYVHPTHLAPTKTRKVVVSL